jgi:hypothetical protein
VFIKDNEKNAIWVAFFFNLFMGVGFALLSLIALISFAAISADKL